MSDDARGLLRDWWGAEADGLRARRTLGAYLAMAAIRDIWREWRQ